MLTLDVRMYDGARITYPMPEGATWHDASTTMAALRRQFPGSIRRVEIVQPPSTPVLERLNRTLVGAW